MATDRWALECDDVNGFLAREIFWLKVSTLGY